MKIIRSVLMVTVMAMLSLAASAGQPEWPEVIFPEQAKAYVVAANMKYNGVPMKIWEFRTGKKVEQILSFYKETWSEDQNAKDGKPDYIEYDVGPWKVVSKLEDGFQTTVQVMKINKTSAVAVVGMSKLLEEDEVAEKPAIFIPEGSEVISVLEADDSGSHSTTLLARNKMSKKANFERYLAHFSSRGWNRVGGDERGQTNSALIMKKRGSELNLTFNRAEGSTEIVGVMTH